MPTKKKPGLYANIHAKQERIAHGSGETMRKPGAEGAPAAGAFKQAEGSKKASPAEKPKRKSKAP